MGYLSGTVSAIDSSGLTISMWFKADQLAVVGTPLISFALGNYKFGSSSPSFQTPQWHFIELVDDGVGGLGFQWGFVGRDQALSDNLGNAVTGVIQGQITSGVVAGAWNHLFFAVDTSQPFSVLCTPSGDSTTGTIRDTAPTPRVQLALNGTQVAVREFYTYQTMGAVGGGTGYFPPSPQTVSMLGSPAHSWCSKGAFSLGLLTELSGAGTVTTPGFAMNLNGSTLRIPGLLADLGPDLTSAILNLAEVQIYLNQAIDVSFLSNFIGGDRRPVDPAIAAGTFGPQTYLLRRNSKLKLKFDTNEGAGGALIKTGTMSDYFPGPGQ